MPKEMGRQPTHSVLASPTPREVKVLRKLRHPSRIEHLRPFLED